MKIETSLTPMSKLIAASIYDRMAKQASKKEKVEMKKIAIEYRSAAFDEECGAIDPDIASMSDEALLAELMA